MDFFGIQLAELWRFVQKKVARQWVWLALNPAKPASSGAPHGQPGPRLEVALTPTAGPETTLIRTNSGGM